MEANGWVFSVTSNGQGISGNGLYGTCKTNTFWGWASSEAVGSAKAILKGHGTATLKFGNCYDSGNVKVYLNDLLLETATPKQFLSVTFAFSENDVLIVKEDFAVMQLNSLEIACPISTHGKI